MKEAVANERRNEAELAPLVFLPTISIQQSPSDRCGPKSRVVKVHLRKEPSFPSPELFVQYRLLVRSSDARSALSGSQGVSGTDNYNFAKFPKTKP